MAVRASQAGVPQPDDQLAAGDRLRPEGDRSVAQLLGQVVVVALEAAPGDAQRLGQQCSSSYDVSLTRWHQSRPRNGQMGVSTRIAMPAWWRSGQWAP